MNMTIIGTKWVFRNKLDKNGVVSRNKARLVAQVYNQQERINYDETYAPVARLESIRILLAYACVLDFKLFQMDVKSAFLNGFINQEVYVAQPLGFIDFAKPNHVYRLKKALYALKQPPKALAITLNRLERSIHRKGSTSETEENTTNPPTNLPTHQAPHTLLTIKLPILKKGKYDIWAMKMKHYLEHIDYPIWEVIQKENDLVQVSTDTHGQIRVLPPKTVEEILARERERKARTTLLMDIPDDHLAKFHKMTDAKEMWEAIKSIFEGLHKCYDRFQSLLSQLETHGEGVSTEDANQKFLRVFDYDVEGSTGSSSNTHNVAFVSSDSTSSTNEVNTAYGVSTSSVHNSQKKGSSSYTDDLMYSFFANQSSGPQLDHEDLEQTRKKLHFDAKKHDGFDKSKVECFSCHNTRHFAREYRSKGNQDSVDWTGHAEDETEDYALMAYNSSNSGSNTEMSAKDKSGLGYGSQIHDGVLSYENDIFATVFDSSSPPMTGNCMPPKSDFRIDESKFTYGPKQPTTSESDAKTIDLASCESSSSGDTLETTPKPVESKPKVINEPKVWSDASIIEEYESDSDNEYVSQALVEEEKPSCVFINTIKHVKNLRQTIHDQGTCSQNPKVDQRNWTGLKSKRIGLGYGFTKMDFFVCGSFSHLIRDYDFHEKRMAKQIELNKQKGKSTGPRENRPVWNNVQSQAALTSTARKVNTARPKVNEIRRRHNVYKSHLPIRRLFNKTTTPKANFAQHKVNIAWDKSDNLHQTLKGKGIVDSGCSRHMTRNKAYLVGYQDFNGGHVAFGGSKGQITSKGKFTEKSDEGFLVGYSLSSKAFRPITAENKASHTAGPKETNNNTGAARANGTNFVNTASTPVNAASTPPNQDDLQIPALEDIYDHSRDGIFTSASYDDEGAMVDFINLETTMNVSLIPTSRIHSIYPTT
nr:copia protein [Tanacetum cinerariifolium]